MPQYRLSTYHDAPAPRCRIITARDVRAALKRYAEALQQPGVRKARLETLGGKRLAGCAAYGTVPLARQEPLPLERPR